MREGTTVEHLLVTDWDGKIYAARIANNRFEISENKTFTDARRVSTIKVKDADKGNVLVKIETPATNVLPFDRQRKIPDVHPSPNGQYELRMQHSGLGLYPAGSQGSPLWTSADFGNPNGFSVASATDHYTARMTSMPGQQGTGTDSPGFIAVSDDGHVIFYRRDGYAVWMSKKK